MACTVVSFPISAFSEKDLKRFEAFANEAKEVKLNFYEITQDRKSVISKAALEGLFSETTSEIAIAQREIKEWLAGMDGTSREGEPDRVAIQNKMKTLLSDNNIATIKPIMAMLAGDPELLDTLTTPEGAKATIEDLRLQNIIGMNMLLNNMASAVDLYKTTDPDEKGISDTEKGIRNDFLTKEENLGVSVARIRLSVNIGGEYLRSIGKATVGEGKAQSQSIAYQAAIGESILNNLAAQGLITDSDNKGQYAVGDMLNLDSQPMNKVSALSVGNIVRIIPGTFNTSGGAAHKSNNKLSNAAELNKVGTQNLKDMGDILNQFQLILTKQTEGVPKNEAQPLNERTQDASLNPTMTKVVEQYLQQNSFQLGGASVAFFNSLHSVWESTAGKRLDGTFDIEARHQSFISKVLKMYKADNSDVLIKALGLAIPNEYAARNNNQLGANQAVVSPLVGMMEHWDDVGDKQFFYSYFFANNTRLFLNETTVQFQASKLIRAVIRANTPTEYSGEAKQDFLNRFGKHTGLSEDVITGKEATPKELQDLLDMQAKGENIVPKLATDPEATRMDGGLSIFEMVDAIETINEIRNGNENSFNSSWLTEVDATASGLVLNMIQNMHIEDVQTMLEEMGLGEGNAAIIKDAYGFAGRYVDKLANEYKDKIEKVDSGEIKGADLEPRELARLEAMKKLGYENREVMKYLIMKFMYGQSDQNNEKAFGKTIADKIVNVGMTPDDIVTAWEIFKPADAEPLDLSEYTKNEYKNLDREAVDILNNQLTELIAETTGNFLLSKVLQPVYAEKFSQTSKDIKTLVTIMNGIEPLAPKKSGSMLDSVTIAAPLHVMEAVDNGKDDINRADRNLLIGLDKSFETLVEGDGKLLTTLRHFNPTSAQVVPIHGIDAAILIRSISQVYDKLLVDQKVVSKTDMDSLKKAKKEVQEFMAKNPMAPIHDAVMIPPNVAALISETYEQNLMDVNYNYDIPTELIKEIQFRLDNTEHKFPERTAGAFKKISDRVAENFAKRRKLMDEKYKNNKTGKWETIPFSFAEDLSQPVLDKVKEEYNERNKNYTTPENKKTTPKKEKPVEKATPKDPMVTDPAELSEKVTETLAEMADMMAKNELFFYDLETTGLPDEATETHKNIEIVQIGYTNGKIEVEQYVKQTNDVLNQYIEDFKNIPSIANSKVYNDIQQYLLDGSGPYSNSITPLAALRKFKKDIKSVPNAKVAGFNNVKYDDKVLEASADKILDAFTDKVLEASTDKISIKSDYDVRPLVRGDSTDYARGTNNAGKLGNADVKVEGDQAHSALYDAQKTYAVVGALASGETVSFKPKEQVDQTVESILEGINEEVLLNDNKTLLKEINDFIAANKDITFKVADNSKYTSKDGKETIDVENTKLVNDFVNDLGHEITHAKTYEYIANNPNNPAVKYATKAVGALTKLINKNPEELGRLAHVQDTLVSKGDTAAVAELIAILHSEPKVRQALFAKLENSGKKNMLNKLKTLLKDVGAWISNNNFDWGKNVEADKLIASVESIVSEGGKARSTGKTKEDVELESGRTSGKQSDTRVADKGFKKPEIDTSLRDPISKYITDSNGFMAEVIASKFETAKPWSADLALSIHEKFNDNEVYKTTMETINKNLGNITKSKTYKKLKQYTIGDPKLETIFNQLGAEDLNSRKKMVDLMTTATQQFEAELEAAGYTEEAELTLMDDVFARSGIIGIYRNGVLHDLVNNNTTLDEAISNAEKELGASKAILKEMHKLAKLYVSEPDVGMTKANLEEIGISRGNVNYKNYESLVALYAMNEIEGGLDQAKKVYKNSPELFTKMLGMLQQISAFDTEIHAKEHGSNKSVDFNVSRGNLVDDFSRYNVDIVTIKPGEYASSNYGPDGDWTVLRKPRKGELGLAYKRSTDKMQDGMGTINYIKTGVTVPTDTALSDEYAGGTYTVSPADYSGETKRYAITLTNAERKALSQYTNPAKSLLRAYAHKQRLLATQDMRDDITAGMSREYDSFASINSEIPELIKEQEHPVFITMPAKWNFSKVEDNQFDQTIRDEYQLVDSTLLSDVGGYNKRFQLVRKDVAQVLEGYREHKVFNNETANKVLDAVKDGIRQGKTILIILNIPKIAVDFTAGMTLAMAKGASFQEAFKYSKEAMQGSKRFTKLLNDQSRIDFELALFKQTKTNSKEDKAKLEKLERQKKVIGNSIKNDPFAPAYYHGFMQSLGTDIISRDRDSAQGLQVTMEDLISKFTTDDKGELTKFNNAVKRFADLGGDNFNISYVYNMLANKVENLPAGESPAGLLNDMARDMNSIRKSKDMTKYLAELLAAPNSTIVRLGGAMTVYADLIPRWVMYRHNINASMSDQDAANDALRSLPNYMFGMPSEVKFLSDIYVTPFPSFYLRIQKTIWELATKFPVSFGSQLVIGDILREMFGITGTSVLSANLINKFNNNSIGSSPMELPFIPYSHMAG